MDTRTQDDFTVVSMPQKIDVLVAPALEAELLSLIGKGLSIACDFATTQYISSAGLRVMLIATKKAKAGGSRFILFGMSDQTRHPFELSGFNKIMNIQQSL